MQYAKKARCHMGMKYTIGIRGRMGDPVTEFDNQLWISMVGHVVAHSKEDIRVVCRDEIEK